MNRFPLYARDLEKREQIFAESKQEGAAVRNLLEIRCRNASAASIEAEATRHALEAKKTAHMTARQREIIATITRTHCHSQQTQNKLVCTQRHCPRQSKPINRTQKHS